MIIIMQNTLEYMIQLSKTPSNDLPTNNINELWSVFNRVQEKLINGNFSYGRKNRKARSIKNFTQDLNINKDLWEMANDYVLA